MDRLSSLLQPQRQTREIILYAQELADIYALKTLYDFLEQENDREDLNLKLFFGGHTTFTKRAVEVLHDLPTEVREPPFSFEFSPLEVHCYSDLSQGGDLEIDIALLKNCVVPLSDEEKKALKEKYNVSSREPIVTIGYASPYSPGIRKLIETISRYATLYLVGTALKEEYSGLISKQAESKINCVFKHGVLKDYYALADAAINACNLSFNPANPHNFVEATEGGPLFMVPGKTTQYGYKQLVRAGAIRECSDAEELTAQVEDFLKNFRGNTGVLEARARHLLQTRERYLPVILAKMRQMRGEEVPLPESDLEIISRGSQVRIKHPDSDWHVDKFNYFNLPDYLITKKFTLQNSFLTEILQQQFPQEIKPALNTESHLKYLSSLNRIHLAQFGDQNQKRTGLPLQELPTVDWNLLLQEVKGGKC